MACAACGQVKPIQARGLCRACYGTAWRAGTLARYPATYNVHGDWPVCVCPVPDASPHRDAGMCQRCKRKPVALFSEANGGPPRSPHPTAGELATRRARSCEFCGVPRGYHPKPGQVRSQAAACRSAVMAADAQHEVMYG